MNVQRYGCRIVVGRECQGINTSLADDALEPSLAGRVEDNPRIIRIILDNQQNAIAGRNAVAIVLDRGGNRVGRRQLRNLYGGFRFGSRLDWARSIAERQVEGECTAAARFALEVNFAAEKVRQLSADSETKPSPPILAAGA